MNTLQSLEQQKLLSEALNQHTGNSINSYEQQQLQQLRNNIRVLKGLQAMISVIDGMVYIIQQEATAKKSGAASASRLSELKAVVRARKEVRNRLKAEVEYALKSNAKMIQRLSTTSQALINLLTNQLLPCVGVVSQLCATFVHLAPLEVELFDKSPLPLQAHVHTPTNPSFPFTHAPAPSWRENVRQALKLPRCHAPEVLLEDVLKAKDRLEDTKALEQLEQNLINTATAASKEHNSLNNTLAIEAFEQRDAERSSKERALAAEQRVLQSEAEKGIHSATCASSLANDWWHQPAQLVTPWVQVEGKPLQQWLQDWRGLCALIDPQ
jgi:hypothetical protein